MPGGRFSVKAIFRAVDKFSAPVSRMQRRMLRFTTSARRGLRSVAKASRAAADGVRRMGLAVGVAAVAAAAGIGSIVKTGANFEQAITNVGAVGLKSRDQIKELEDQAIKLGATTKFTATEVAEGMETMAKAGFEAKEIMAGIPGVLSAAAASGLELAEVSGVVSNVLKGMGLEASEAARVADVLALASTKTQSTIGSLGEGMKNVAATARQLNIPLEEVVASIALLQDVGVDASVSGTAMSVMLVRLTKPSKQVAAEMKKVGVTFQNSEGDMLPFTEVLNNISKAMNNAGGDMAKLAFLQDLVGARGAKAAANLADLSKKGKVTKLTGELKDAAGVADKMAKIRMDTLIGDFTLFQSAVDGVKVKLFGMKRGPLRDIVQFLTKKVSEPEFLIGIIEGAKFLGGEFMSVINEARAVIENVFPDKGEGVSWVALLKSFAGGMAKVVAGSVILGLAFGAVFVGVVAAALGLFEGVKAAWNSVIDFLGAGAFAIVDWLGNLIAVFEAGGAAIWIKMKEIGTSIIQGFVDGIVAMHRAPIDAIMSMGGGVVSALKGLLGISSPSRLLKGLGADTSMGFEDGIKSGLGGIRAAAAAMGGAAAIPVDATLQDRETSLGLQGTDAASEKAIVASNEQRSTESLINANTQLAGGSAGELTVRDETGRVEVTKQPKAGKIKLEQPSGAF